MTKMFRKLNHLFSIWVMIFFWVKFTSVCISSELAWTCVLCQGITNVQNHVCKGIRAVMKKKSDIVYNRSNKTILWGPVVSRGFKPPSIWIWCKFQIHLPVLLALRQEAALCTPETQGTDWKFPFETEGGWTYCLCSSPLKLKLRKTSVDS